MTGSDKPGLSFKLRGAAFISLGILLFALLIFWLIMGYVVRHTSDPNPMMWTDGIGRMIDKSPDIISMIIPYWPGIVWFVIDCILALAAIVFGNMAVIKGKELWAGIDRKE